MIRELGTALYGAQWQSPMAKALGINLRTVQRWAAGQNRSPDAVLIELAALLRAKQAKDAALLAALC